MSPPVRRPLPRFVADATREGYPYGRWAERLTEAFVGACAPLAGEAGEAGGPGEPQWFPERAWGGRVYVPVTAPAERPGPDGQPVEYFGHVSFVRPEDGEPDDLRGVADFTDVTAQSNPDWRIDLNEEVIGTWRGEAERVGQVTLVWGAPLVPGAVAVTADLDQEVLDQAPVDDGRFTLVAVDAVKGFGDDLYLDVRLWGKGDRELAVESLYDRPE
jgi:hypothetical protein